MSELKKCPFCGSRAKVVENHDWGTVHIRCEDEFGTCSVLPCTEDLYHPHEAEAEWNNRTNDKEILNKAIDEFAEKLLTDVESFTAEVNGMQADVLTLDYFTDFVLDMAEKMKKGEQNE